MGIKSCVRASANSMNGFHLLLVGLFLCGLWMAFAPVAAGQMTEKVLHPFCGNTSGVISNLVRDVSGNFYGTTQFGGSGYGASGTVFKVDPTAKQTLLYSFSGNPALVGDGAQPIVGLVMDAAGNPYGTTAARVALTETVPFSRWIRRQLHQSGCLHHLLGTERRRAGRWSDYGQRR